MIAVCVGHSRRGDGGAVACDGETTEHSYNTDLAERIAPRLEAYGIPCAVIGDYKMNGYPQAMKWLAGELKTVGALVAVELHFNWSAVRKATGHEWLHWHGSEAGRKAARALDLAMRLHYPTHYARGVKAITAKDNGAAFVRLMPCPAVIAEPFFGSNPHDWERVAEQPETLAVALAQGLAAAHDILTGTPRR